MRVRPSVELVVAPDAEGAARAAADRLAAAARAGDAIALSGGSTPRRAYEIAAIIEPDWTTVELWWADERCVPPEDERSNYRLVRETLLDRLALAPARVHRIRGELAPELAAHEYDADLRSATLTLALLGIGPDGHTASLFPHAPGLAEMDRLAVAAEPGLEPFVPRVTLTPPALERARVVYLATGSDKADAVRRAFGEAPDESIPASLVRGRETLAVLDAAAASDLPRELASE